MVLTDHLYPIKIMTKDEFMSYYEEKYYNKPIKISRKIKTSLVFIFANLIWIEKTLAKTSVSSASLNRVGSTMLGIVRDVAYWIALIVCLVEILKSLLNGDTKGVGKIIMKGLLAFGACYYLPFLFDIIKEVFSQ